MINPRPQSETLNLTDWKMLLSRGLATGYPTVMWRMPGMQQMNAMVDLRPSIQNEPGNLESRAAGFMINPFLDHHPTQPFHIKADLVLTIEKETASIELDPALSDSALSQFLKTPITISHRSNVVKDNIDQPYTTWVNDALASFSEKGLHKVVLARYEDVSLPQDFDPIKTFQHACERYPNAFVYLLNTEKHGQWLGATPETLLSIENNHIFSTHALAGTQSLQDGQSLADVAWTQKEIEEQAMVSRYVIDCFKKIRLREFEEVGPKTIKAGKLAHLLTTFKVDMKDVNMQQLGTIMLDLLHPTSAVCGMPLANALEFIKKHEQFDRQLYAGFLGPVNFRNHTQLFVNLRCARIYQKTARLFAGAGITKNSIPEKELEETALKMNTIKRLLQNP